MKRWAEDILARAKWCVCQLEILFAGDVMAMSIQSSQSHYFNRHALSQTGTIYSIIS
jgi:hypothetical protein